MLPHGAFAPVPTPLNARLDFESDALQAHLEWLASQRLEGALILGTNGEFPSLSVDERLEVAEAAAAGSAGLQLMLGIGSCSLPEVLTLLDAAADLGFGSALCPPPFYFRSASNQGLAAFFSTVLDHARVPMLLYHIPQVTGIAISDELLDILGPHPNLVGVKDSSGSSDELGRLATRFGNGVYLVGSDLLVTSCLEAGGRGSISAAASVAPALVGAVHRGASKQHELDAVRRLLEAHGLGPSVKAILRSSGFGEYATRPPLVGLDGPASEALMSAFRELVAADQRPARS